MAATQYTFSNLLIGLFLGFSTASGLKEVCQWETFEAKCHEDEVIMITEAHYGRMGVGRCQPRDFGFAGCSTDVSAIMHARCSGRQHCSIPVPDPTMFAATPCPKDLVTYLKADYECIKVAKSNSDNCDDQILTAMSGDIAKPPKNGKKSKCPHRILAQPGHTVNVYLYDFYNKDSNTQSIPQCIPYGYVSEGSTKTPKKICGGEFRKNHLIYSSNSNVVEIMLAEHSSHSHHYLLHYEVVGCRTIQAPLNAFVKIQDNTAVVMCNFSHIASELVCSDHKWIGDVQNCTGIDSEFLKASSLALTSLGDVVANSGVFAVICVGLACGLLFGIGILTFIRARRFKTKQISDLPQISEFEKPAIPQNEKSPMHVDEYQSVYVPITMDSHSQYVPVHQNNIYEAPRSSALSAVHAVRPSVLDDVYGPLRANQAVPTHACNHSIYNITGLHLDNDNGVSLFN